MVGSSLTLLPQLFSFPSLSFKNCPLNGLQRVCKFCYQPTRRKKSCFHVVVYNNNKPDIGPKRNKFIKGECFSRPLLFYILLVNKSCIDLNNIVSVVSTTHTFYAQLFNDNIGGYNGILNAFLINVKLSLFFE